MPHITPRKTYYKVFAALLVLTVITIAIALVDLGPLNVYVALTIAFGKTMLVVLFFMHVIYSPNLVKVFVAGGLLWLIILIALTLNDYLTRGWLPVDGAW
ncbi:MAG: cytochrome C oxidase subunit IV family protein [Bryobacteraceae bacterium]